MNYNDVINWITVNKTLISASFGALVGATATYIFNKQNENEKLTSIIKAIEEKTDICLRFIYKAILLLEDYNRNHFPNKPKVNHVLDYYLELLPSHNPEGWEDFKLNPIKTFWNEYLPTFNKCFNWFFSIINKIKKWFKNLLKANILNKQLEN